ncbi:class I SAM-dependent methyltransferase [Kribbella ginsengisoli]|uniref:Methyltransferase family protein n=1 Tax=Kribbella ginsengisoli TaxID=363865 RepID=A0ABP6Z4V0_9ACTN
MMSWEEAQSFDRLAAEYDRLGELDDGAVGEWLPSVLPADPSDQRAGRALDLGRGAGRLAVLLAAHFEQVDAVDLSGVLDIEGSYDFIVSSAAMHHVRDLPAALAHIKSLLTPSGQAVLIDVVSPRAANPGGWLLGGELRRLARDLVRGDRYLSRQQFEEVYSPVFPGAAFTQIGHAHAMCWRSAAPISTDQGAAQRSTG